MGEMFISLVFVAFFKGKSGIPVKDLCLTISNVTIERNREM
jgi:hypothetical protein